MIWAWILGFIFLIIKLSIIMIVLLTAAAYLVWVERKLLGRMQARFGPNRAGWFGLLQPLVDLVKLITKEDTVPEGASKTLFLLAPGVTALMALLIFAVIPFGKGFTLRGRPIPLVITDLNVGVLYFLALSSLSVYGIVLGGWASNSKYSLLGGIRGAAQMISYEITLGLSLVPVVMLARSFSLVEITNAQRNYPFILVQPVSFLLFLIAAVAEIKPLFLQCKRCGSWVCKDVCWNGRNPRTKRTRARCCRSSKRSRPRTATCPSPRSNTSAT